MDVDVLKRIKIREQEPKVRATNFYEVCLGYNEEEAVAEASRCLNCKNPNCVKDCPVSIKIPDFISHIKNKEYVKAYEIISEDSALPSICGRVCPQETQCEMHCVRGIKGEAVSIGKIERFVGDYIKENNIDVKVDIKENNIKVAVVGAGPAGLTCAGELRKLGYDVTIYEALHKAGGVLTYGIPEFRLPKDKIVKKEVEKVEKLGVKIKLNTIVGKTIKIDDLLNDGVKAIFVASGAGLPQFMHIPGENANGVSSANEFLTRVNLMHAYDKNYDTPIKVGKVALVIGGGNVAMDAARTALRLGAETHIVYRRGEEELPARAEEVHHAKEEGVIFDLLTNIKEILVDENNNTIGAKLVKMELGEADASGRRSPKEVVGSDYEVKCDTIIMALGTTPNPIIVKNTEGIKTNKKGCIVVNEESMTTKKGVFAGGDIVIGAATVILAMEAGKKAAKYMDEYIKK